MIKDRPDVWKIDQINSVSLLRFSKIVLFYCRIEKMPIDVIFEGGILGGEWNANSAEFRYIICCRRRSAITRGWGVLLKNLIKGNVAERVRLEISVNAGSAGQRWLDSDTKSAAAAPPRSESPTLWFTRSSILFDSSFIGYRISFLNSSFIVSRFNFLIKNIMQMYSWVASSFKVPTNLLYSKKNLRDSKYIM